MDQQTRHPSDEILLGAIDGELPPRLGAETDGHLATCEPCRARHRQLAAAASDVSAAYVASAARARGQAAVRARLAARMVEPPSVEVRWWRFRALERLAALRPATTVAVALAAIVVVLGQVLPYRAVPMSPDTLVGSVESAALPIRSLTPGAARAVGLDELCAARTPVRPPVPAVVRTAVLRDYRMEDVPSDEYELDYLITPELGGTPDRRNLWPERYGSRVWNAGVKDRLEELLPQLVCQGAIDLATAQQDIAKDWIAAYKKYFHVDRPIAVRAGLLREAGERSALRGPQHVLVTARAWRARAFDWP
ncbi:MAG: zf-HC2 domain-containing protein [Acidobacteriota bacterium]